MDLDVSNKLDDFFLRFKCKNFKRYDLLIKPTREPEGVFYLKEGVVRQYAITPSGEELTLNMFKPNSFFPTGWLVNGSISPHFFEAMTNVTLWVAPRKKVLEFFRSDSAILLDLVKRIYKGLDGYFMRMENMMTGSARSRLIAEILIYARRFGKVEGSMIRINFKLTEKDIAAESGIARETVSREISKLKSKGLIVFEKNNLSISSIQSLEEELLNT